MPNVEFDVYLRRRRPCHDADDGAMPPPRSRTREEVLDPKMTKPQLYQLCDGNGAANTGK